MVKVKKKAQLKKEKKLQKDFPDQPMEVEESIAPENPLTKFRQTLPIYTARSQLIEKFKSDVSTLIILGETGSGKTTQIPQYIYESGANNGIPIAITQPRRVAAVSLATRVSEEMGLEFNVGSTVGYSVRFEDTTSEDTRIKYMTDGMLLREAMIDPKLKRYSWVILDEAHERSIHTDVLFGIVKMAQAARATKKPHRRLKIIIMSATMDVDHFKNYFKGSEIINIQGRMHFVEILHVKNKQEDYAASTTTTILQLHQDLPPDEHILAFLTGQEEIQSGVEYLKKIDKKDIGVPMEIYPLYSSLSQELQLKAISMPTPGSRRIILATNIAETSVTIPGVKAVVDCGKVKARFHVGGTGIDSLKVVTISQTQAIQRSGRAGRETPGKCYRLYTKEDFKEMAQFTVPEILRSNVSNVILQLVKIGVKNPLSFDWIDKPSKEAMENAIKQLHSLEALVSPQEPLELTQIGSQMAVIPLDPPLAKVLVSSARFCVVEPIVTILSILSSGDGILERMYQEQESEFGELRKRFFAPEGDFISYLKIFREFRKNKKNTLWCRVHRFNYRALDFAFKVRADLLKLCDVLGLDRTSKVGGEEMREQVRKCFYEALPSHVAQLTKGNLYKWIRPGQPPIKVKLHPSSVLFTSRPPFVLFTEITQLSEHKDINYIRNVSLVDPHWINQ